jgi:hypothetical protein
VQPDLGSAEQNEHRFPPWPATSHNLPSHEHVYVVTVLPPNALNVPCTRRLGGHRGGITQGFGEGLGVGRCRRARHRQLSASGFPSQPRWPPSPLFSWGTWYGSLQRWQLRHRDA